MTAEEFAKTLFHEDDDNIFPDGTDAQTALSILVENFLGEYILMYSGSTTQWNSEVVYEILRRYPRRSLWFSRLVNRIKDRISFFQMAKRLRKDSKSWA